MISKEEIKEIKAWCNSRKLKYTINDDGTVDIEGDINIKMAKDGKFPIRFGKITGNFSCVCNRGSKLTTLEGGPSIVSGNYDCSRNKLTSLEGAPATVGGDFDCSENKLTTLKGGPATVGGYFDCSENKLTTLEGGPATVSGYFRCYRNNLTTLNGAPATVDGYFNCSENNLTTLEGSPATVGGYFCCSENNLTTLAGAPTSVGGRFDCSKNKLTSLEGIENTTIEGELKIGESVTSFDFVPKKFNMVTCDFHKIIVTDNMNLVGGHYIIAPRVRTLGVLRKNSVTMDGADKTMDLFHLPIRVDILGSVPPDIEKIEPSSISHLELHVPKGEVEVYSNHKQWKRAFLITDDNGTIVFSNPKNAALYEGDHAQKVQKAKEEAKEEEERKRRKIEKAKAEKLEQMQNFSHESLCRQLLAAYQPEFVSSWNTYRVNVTLKSGLKLTLEVEKDECPINIWQNLLKYVERLENVQLDDQPLGCEVEITMKLS